MAVAKPKIIIPKLTAREIRIANDCAVLIWNGISYIDGKRIISDRELLVYFSIEFRNITNRPKIKFLLSQRIIDDLIIVSLLKPMYRKQNELSFPHLFNFLQQQYQTFNRAFNRSTNSAKKLDLSTNLVVSAGKAVVRPGVSLKAGYRIPFASRLLFFAAPHMFVFNYANRLAEKQLNYQSRPHYAYPIYGKDMLEALRKNWPQLSKYNIPTERLGRIEPDVSLAYRTNWWARRVLDIALLIKFRVFRPDPSVLGRISDLKYICQARTTVKCP